MTNKMPLFERTVDKIVTDNSTVIAALNDRIAELEKDLSNAQAMGDKDQSIRDLEQRAKGVVNGYVSGCKWALGAQYNEEVVKNRAIIYSKALKDPS